MLGLDAPVIALVWQDYLSRHLSSPLFAAGRAGLALTVWAIYLADRLLDIRHTRTGAERARHRFCREHRDVVQSLLAIVLCCDLATAAFWIRPVIFENGLFVFAGVLVYFGAFPVARCGSTRWKKPCAAFLFTTGIFIVAWAMARHPVRSLGLSAGAFFALCLANLLLIESWEQSRESKRAWTWMAILSVCGIGWFWPVTASAAGLAILSARGKRVSVPVRCVLADAVLLSPLLFR